MKIGFLGCGAMGSIYAGNLTKAHEVYIFDAMPKAVPIAANTAEARFHRNLISLDLFS